MTDIHSLTAVELLSKYRSEELTPVEAVKALFERIEKYNPEINAFVTLNKNGALLQAEQASRVYKHQHPARPLEGIPVAIKDLTHTEGLRTTYGSPVFKDNIPDRNATIVQRLIDAGAIIMGKTNTPEFGYKATTDNPLFGPTRNPWNMEKAAGGSSGGSAAAVAAGFVPIAEGSDGGGSIRIPAALCGVYGFKPNYGRIPHDNHLDGVFGSHEPYLHFGTLSRSTLDAALMFDIIQGAADTDPFSLPALQESAYNALERVGKKHFKIGWTTDFGIYEIDAEVRSLFEAAVQKLESTGCVVTPLHINMKKTLPEYIHYFETLWTAGLAAGAGDLSEQHPDKLSKGFKEMVERGRKLSAVEFKSLEKYRSYLWHTLQDAFQTYDVIVSPTLAVTAFNYDLEGPGHINSKPIKTDSDWVMTQIYNLTGHPAMSIPIGFNHEHLPVGMQVSCRRLHDIDLLQFTKMAENVLQTETLTTLF
ncbi:amidase/aspartyl-tRNA(Asn)/glutamyl-tRNA(Gln) amidotransferase subunit A [Scopulibacillus darangshiensis]|uniref:Amidase/aspartyl-tRNA(Asn)/glutamyl-tRNA(Gln) amidotransferase subunit A n=1 Tax=Scopulibacillus darangshiensis TaxID=442528 RepID=A0A4R2NYM7_9BACL|nr:amidase [Scopulibacillus darangshiensis]TCP26631.1 amidase/aspartyl-tRNA(Asn)/glutamyl-tRNA(Gln) amidotransferase subunit A [Scopulibacillus darangshiensis]